MGAEAAPATGWGRIGSVRVRTTAAATLIVGCALTFGAIGLVAMLHRSQLANIESAARLRAHDVAALVRSGSLPSTLPGASSDSALVQVIDSHGNVVAATDNVVGEEPISRRTLTNDTASFTLGRAPIGESGSFRVVALRVDSDATFSVVYAAVSLEAAQETLGAVSSALAIGTPLLVALVAVMTWLLTGRALRPVERIRAEVSEITAHALGRRVPEPGGSDEIARLARTMNEMLDRIEGGTEAQRRFVADASHELRSPLASLRTQLEVSRAHPSGVDWLATTDDSLAEVDRMERLTRDLLTLARLGSATQHRAERVDIAEMLRDEAAALSARGVVAVDVDITGAANGAVVIGDPDQLVRVFRNLLDNAERHAANAVAIRVASDEQAIEVTVADDGPGIAVADRERVFERFTRLDDARDRDSGGTGLGLAIGREIVAAHGGTISVVAADRGASFAIRLPTA